MATTTTTKTAVSSNTEPPPCKDEGCASTTSEPTTQGITTTPSTTSGETPTRSTPGNSLSTAIVGASAAIASLLLLIALSIIILTLVILTRRKKRVHVPAAVSNNYETVSRDSMGALPYEGAGLENNAATNELSMSEIQPRGWDAYPSLPRPPTDPGFATIGEWVRAKQNAVAAPFINPSYASTLSVASNSNVSEPPEYESVEDAQRKYFLPRRGALLPFGLDHSTKLRTQSLQDFRVKCRDPSWSATVDRVRNRQDMASKTKMAQLLEEEADYKSEGSPPTNSFTALSFPYGCAGDAAAGADVDTKHSVDNALYEATKGTGETENSNYMTMDENFYENSDQGPPIRASVQTRATKQPCRTTEDISQVEEYTTMNSLLSLPLPEEQYNDSKGSQSEEREVPRYSKVNKLRKQRSVSPDDPAPPIPPYLAEERDAETEEPLLGFANTN
jgi:hypothetical protein